MPSHDTTPLLNFLIPRNFLQLVVRINHVTHFIYLLCMRDRTWDDSSWLRTDQAAFFTHSLEKFHKIQINSNKLGKIRIKLKQAVSKVSWLWPYCCRKGAKRPDVQQCKLLVKEGSRATWHITVQTTSEKREQSNLMHNSVNYQWRKGAQRPDIQYCSL